MQGYGYGDVQRMQAPQPDMWEQQSAAQQPQSAPPAPQHDDFVGGASQSFFGEMPPRSAVRLCTAALLLAACFLPCTQALPWLGRLERHPAHALCDGQVPWTADL